MTAGTPAIAATPNRVPRTKVLVTAARPTARALWLTPGPALFAFGTVPVLWRLVTGGTDLDVALIAMVVIGSSALSCAVEDAAATTTAAAPTTRLEARVLRLAMLSAVVLVTWGTCFVGAAIAGVSIEEPDRLVAACLATAGISVAAASWMADDLEHGAGTGGSLVSVVIVLTSTALNQRIPAFPTLMDLDGGRDKWLVVAAVAWAAAAWLNRDPAARTPWSTT